MVGLGEGVWKLEEVEPSSKEESGWIFHDCSTRRRLHRRLEMVEQLEDPIASHVCNESISICLVLKWNPP